MTATAILQAFPEPVVITDEMSDRLEQLGIQCEFLMAEGQRESDTLSLFKTLGECRDWQQQVRMMVGEYMFQLVATAFTTMVDSKIWFDAMAMMDLLFVRHGSLASTEALPLTCTAVFRMLLKVDIAGVQLPLSGFNYLIEMFHERLHQLEEIQAFEEVSEAGLHQREVEVLQALNWRFAGRFSPHTWLEKIFRRFDTIGEESMDPALTQSWQSTKVAIWEFCVGALRGIVLVNACSCDLSPRKLANGLFFIGLIHSGLLSLDAMRMPSQCEEEWQKLSFPLRTNCGGTDFRNGRSLDEEVQVLRMLETATCCNVEELHTSALSVVNVNVIPAQADPVAAPLVHFASV